MIPALLLLIAADAPTESVITPCGLEEVGVPALKVCPGYIIYDEEGEEVRGEANAGRDAQGNRANEALD